MSLQAINENGFLVLSPDGPMNAETSPTLDRDILQAVEESVSPVVLDFARVPFISSLGLRTVVKVAKAVKDRAPLIVSGLQPQLVEMFRLAGLDRLVEIRDAIPT